MSSYIHRLCYNRDYNGLLTAIRDGDDVDELNLYGETPLFICREIKYFQALLDAGANVNANSERDSVLSRSIKYQDTDVVKLLIERGADIHYKNGDGYPILALAIQRGEDDLVLDLVSRGADVHERSKGGWTSLMFAIKHLSEETVKRFIELGVDVNAKNEVTDTLTLAKKYQSEEIVAVLMERGAMEIERDEGPFQDMIDWKNAYKLNYGCGNCSISDLDSDNEEISSDDHECSDIDLHFDDFIPEEYAELPIVNYSDWQLSKNLLIYKCICLNIH